MENRCESVTILLYCWFLSHTNSLKELCIHCILWLDFVQVGPEVQVVGQSKGSLFSFYKLCVVFN